MISILRKGRHWVDLFRDRVELREFDLAGIPRPLFFFMANAEDSARGEVVDVVSGSKATLVGGASCSRIDTSYGKVSSTQLRGIPCVALGGTGGLAFPGVPSVVDSSGVMWVGVMVRTANAQASLFSGQPTERRRTLVSRSFRNPGGSGTSMSGWTTLLSQYKAGTSEATYNLPVSNARVAYTTSAQGDLAPNRFDTLWGTKPDSHLRLFFIRVNRAPEVNGAEVFMETENDAYSQYSATSYTSPPAWTDPLDRDLLIGCTLDQNSGAFYTDFLDGDVVAVGIWGNTWGPRKDHVIQQYRLGAHMRGWFDFLPRLAAARADTPNGPVHAIPPPPKTRYVSSTGALAVQALSIGSTVVAGQTFRVASTNKIYRALTAGVIGDLSVASRSVATTQEGYAYIGRIRNIEKPGNPFILVREISGDTETTPSYSLSTDGLLPRDTVSILNTHSYNTNLVTDVDGVKAQIDYLKHGAYLGSTRPWYSVYPVVGLTGSAIKLLVSPDSTESIGAEVWELQLSSGNFYLEGLTPRVRNLRFIAGRCRVFMENIRPPGGFTLFEATIPIDILNCYISIKRGIAQDYGSYGTSDISGPEYDSYVNIMAAAINTSTGGGLSLSMYGGAIVGPALDVGQPHGNTTIRYFGTQHKSRTRDGDSIDAGVRYFYSTHQKPNAGVSQVHYVGGVPGQPRELRNSFVQSARRGAVTTFYDGLRGDRETYVKHPTFPSTMAMATSIHRRASMFRLAGQPMSFAVPPLVHYIHNPLVLRRYSTLQTTSALRIHLTGTSALADGVLLLCHISYVKSSGAKGVIHYTHFSTYMPYTEVAASMWVSPKASVGYVSIPLPPATVGDIEVSILGVKTATSGEIHIDPYFEVM